MPKKYDYSGWSKEDLIKRIHELEKRKKYGLVWDEEREPEKVVLQCKKELPVLKEVKEKEIKNDPDKPTHILIEGDNYHALSVLNYTHENSVDVIYIDPPYNKGVSGEWKYNDKWVDNNDFYRHSKWLSFMSRRLNIAKNLLSTKGLIFISIDDIEYAHLKILCDEIFGLKKFVATLVWEKKKKGSHLNDFITNVKEYVLVYCKDEQSFNGLVGQVAKKRETYPCINPGNAVGIRIFPKGIKSNYKKKNFTLPKANIISAGNMKLTLLSDLKIENGKFAEDVKVESEWRYTQDKIYEFASKGTLYITTKLYFRHEVLEPRYKKLKDLLMRVEKDSLLELQGELINKIENGENEEEEINKIKEAITNIENGNYASFNIDNLYADGWGSNEDGDNELRDFFGEKVFDYPKPIKLIQKLITSTNLNSGIILDFFAGTGTTAQSVLNLNSLGKKFQFILCTNNEDDNKTGLKIAENICYPRIEKLLNGYEKRNSENIDGKKENLKYYQTAFVPAKATDVNKEKLTKQSVEMLCLRENTFDPIFEDETIKIFKNREKYTAILFDQLRIPKLKETIKDYDKPFHIYIFSLGDDDFADEFLNIKEKVTVKSVPAAILRVYRRIFK